MNYNCFYLEPTERVKATLRRYQSGQGEKTCPGRFGYHNAESPLGELAATKDEKGCLEGIKPEAYAGDPRWPVKCDSCAYVFTEADERQVFQDSIYRRTDTGAEMTLRDAPVGAMWNAFWMSDWRHGPDRKCLVVKMPGDTEWMIDSRASNCDSPCKNCGVPYYKHNGTEGTQATPGTPGSKEQCKRYEDARPHQCWVRQGTPPMLTVGKTGGPTCGAGGGSILVPAWHGFLRNGVLEQC